MQLKDTMSFDDALDKLSKSVYLESPDIWIDLTDKVSDKNFDEMVLFFATKYNTLEVIQYAVDNNYIDLKSPSKNKSYENIGQHLISIALQSNNIEIHNYLKLQLGKKDDIIIQSNKNENTKNAVIKNDNTINSICDKASSYIPEFYCPNCNSNIFKDGYNVSEDITYKFVSSENKLAETSRHTLDTITCSNCNYNIKEISNDDLIKLCKIQNCTNCSSNLTRVGIIDKSKMEFNCNTNKFESTNTTFHCGNCDNQINESQMEYFKI